MLLGIKDDTGLGNNAQEIETASILFDNTVIRPFQNLIIKAIDDILSVNGISLDLYFKTLQPLEFVDRGAAVTKEETERQTGEKLSAQGCRCKTNLKDEEDPCWDGYEQVGTKMVDGKEVPNCVPIADLSDIADELIEMGEDEDLDNWVLVDEREVDYDQEDALDATLKFASTGTARPNANSEQDGENNEGEKFRVRYEYAPLSAGSNSRDFCRKMVSAKKLYRKEDILQMENKSVNAGFGPNGSDTYSIWLYKGGARCNHKWFRKTYMSKDGAGIDVNNPNAETISTTKARSKGFRPEANDNKVSVAPNNMKNKGFINPPSKKDIQGGI